jgi:3-deoxy-7-phosphoheptulonate synthase
MPHHFLGVDKHGQVAIVTTTGNRDCHIILRGGNQPNFDRASVGAACEALRRAHLTPRLMVDCSHANSAKRHERQLDVTRDISAQLADGSTEIFGVMLESNLVAGNQTFSPGVHDPATLKYGQSITDACIGWPESLAALDLLSAAVSARRRSVATA